MPGKTTWTYKKDPLADRKAAMEGQRGFAGKFETKGFKTKKVRESIDEFYTPHKGGEKQ